MKRLFCLLLTGIVLISLAACQTNTDNSDKNGNNVDNMTTSCTKDSVDEFMSIIGEVELGGLSTGMTLDKVAAGADVSKTSVHGFLNGAHEDCSYFTARSIAKFITGGKWENNPCGNLTNSEKAAYEEKIRHLESEIIWRDDKILHLTKQNDSMQTLITNTNKRNTESQDFLRSQIKNRNKAVAILATFLAITTLLIIAALVIDNLNPDIGFFWLEGLLGPHGNGTESLIRGLL